MRNLKKFLALVLAMMMTLSLMVTVNAASFDDAADITDAYTDAVSVLTELGVVKGYGEDDPNEGKFLPKNNITRGEVAAILYRIVTGDVEDSNVHLYKYDSEFTDVGSDQWFTPYVNFCSNNGLIQGRGNGKFDPKGNITGYETLVMILRAIGYNNPTEFSNSDWKFKASGYGARLGMTANIKDGSLGGAATREMVAEIMYRGLQTPTVSYSPLTQYTTNLLVRAGTTGHTQDSTAGSGTLAGDSAATVVYLKDIPSTLFYEVFDVVGLGEGRDNYGRPTITLLGDGKFDNLDHGTKYVAGGDADNKTWTVEDPKKAATATNYLDDVMGDPVLYTVARTPVHTFYNAISECELTKIINKDESISWSKIDEFVNGNHVAARTGSLDATHTTVNTIGAQGRTTEVYNVDGYWTFVYFDTLLGKVIDVTPVTKDTAGHVVSDAVLTVLVNSGTNGTTDNPVGGTDDVVVALTDKTNYTQKVGDLVLLTTYGMRSVVAGTDDVNGNGADTNLTAVTRLANTTLQDGYMTGAAATGATTSASVPKVLADFQVQTPKIKTDGSYDTTPNTDTAVDLAGAPTEKTVTITATVGNAELKTGIIAGSDTYMANNAYLDAHTINEYFAKDDTADTRSLTNSKIGRSFKLYLDEHNNIMGMVESQTDNVGVITSAEPVRIATGKWAIEIELLLPDKSSKTFRLLDDETTAGKYSYFTSQNHAETNFGYKMNKDIAIGDLVKLSAITKDGETYWRVDDTDTDAVKNNGATDRDTNEVSGKVFETGVTNTLEKKNNGTDAILLNDDTVFFVAEYDFHYNNGVLDEGSSEPVGFNVYHGFKNVPTYTVGTAEDIVYQTLDNDDKYVLVYMKSTATEAYSMVNKSTISVDDSFLIVAPIATYADYSTYSVLVNGELTTKNFANGNTDMNKYLETARTANQLVWATGTNAKGYITGVKTIEALAAGSDVAAAIAKANTFKAGAVANSATIWGSKDAAVLVPGNLDPTGMTIAAQNVVYNDKSVLTVSSGATIQYLTVADDCVVKIVNKDLNTAYDGTLDSIKQYQATDTVVIELNNLGYAAYIYIID